MANRTDAIERSKANSGKRCDQEILWPPLYTVKWTREHISIVFFTERHHSERSAVGLTGSYETPPIAQAEVHSSGPTPFLCGYEDDVDDDVYYYIRWRLKLDVYSNPRKK